jgi:predicted phage tail protein
MATAPQRKSFNIGTRKSNLALAQTQQVVDALKQRYPEYEFNIKSKDTAGDRDKSTALKDFTAKNLWTEELEELLVGGQLDFIVHSLKGIKALLLDIIYYETMILTSFFSVARCAYFTPFHLRPRRCFSSRRPKRCAPR